MSAKLDEWTKLQLEGEVAKRGPGKKVLFVDELWRFVDAQSLPAELERVAHGPQ